MNTPEAIKLLRELTAASAMHWESVNSSTRRSPEAARKAEAKAIWKTLTALTDSPITQADVDAVME